MANLIAIDWDSHELRAVVGRGTASGVTLTDMAIIPLPGEEPGQVATALTGWLSQVPSARSKARLLVAIGRGKAELRQLNLPPVPAEELPALVRFQALQSLSISSDSAAVDYLPVDSSDQSTSVIAGGVAPTTIKQIETIVESVSLDLKRIALRPVAAAALYSLRNPGQSIGDCVLVDLLADDVEIVIFRDGKVVFVRSVRMPQQTSGRTTQVAGEIRRSLMACGTDSSVETPPRVIVWGQAKTHDAEVVQLRESLRCDVTTLDPLSLVNVDWRSGRTPDRDGPVAEHTGRMAPLIGLIAADAAAEATGGQSALLIDFLNPRKTIEVEQDNRLWIATGIGAAAVVTLLGFLAWSSLNSKNAQIADRRQQLAELRPTVANAETSIARTEQVDQFLDGSVLWLDQLERLARRMPSSDRAIVKSMTGNSLAREGGGRLSLQAAAKSPVVVDEMESALRDEEHSVSGTGANDLGDREAYRWGFAQSVSVLPTTIRAQRYEAFIAAMDDGDEDKEEQEATSADAPQPAAAVEPAVAAGPEADAPESLSAPTPEPGEPFEPADEDSDVPMTAPDPVEATGETDLEAPAEPSDEAPPTSEAPAPAANELIEGGEAV